MPGLNTVVPLESTTAYDMHGVINGVCFYFITKLSLADPENTLGGGGGGGK